MASQVAREQVVLITGCSKGFGKGIALYFASDSQRRFKVYATMRNMEARQEELKTEAGDKLGDTLFIRELDVTKQETIDKTVKEIIDNEGKIDVLGKRSTNIIVKKCEKDIMYYITCLCSLYLKLMYYTIRSYSQGQPNVELSNKIIF